MAEAQDRSSGWIGAVLGDKWRVDAKIARGGVATVYRATHRDGQRAAIKIMHPELARNEEVRKRFLREGYAANKVGHPGVVTIIDDAVTTDGAAYIVMELLEKGEVLEDRRERLGGRLPVAEAIDVCQQILDVLAVAHEKGIIHRDIKPENIFVLSDGTVKVLDFGIAHIKEAAKAQEATATGLLLGTPEYMAPEQILGKRGQIDAATDIYAVGATLFTLLSGESVHIADTLNMLLVQAASRQARSLTSVAFKDIPRPLISVVDKALALEKPRRWPSARAMQLALRDAIPGRPKAAPDLAKTVPTSDEPAPTTKPLAPKTKHAGPLPRPASLPPPRPASLPAPPRPASLPPAPPRPQAKTQLVKGNEPLEGPASVPTLTNAPKTQKSARKEPVPPPSLPPLSGPTTVIPRRADGDPWTDDMGADDLDGPTVATVGGPAGGAPAPSVRSEVLARSAATSRASSPPPPPSFPPESEESTQLLRTDERLALAQNRTINMSGSGSSPAARNSAPPPALSRSGATPSYLPPPPPRDAAGRSIAPPAVPAQQQQQPVQMTQRLMSPPRPGTMPMMNDARPMQPAGRAPLPPHIIVAIAAAGFLIVSIWIGSCVLLQSN